MVLYLIQHGEAKSKEEDPLRPLSDTGTNNVKKAAAFLESRNIDVDIILHSGKKRAEQTAEIIAGALGKHIPLNVFEEMAPNSDVSHAIREISQTRHEAVMLAGHMPHLSRLASALLMNNPDRGVIAFRNAGIVCLKNDTGNWQLEWMMIPSMM